MSPRAVLVSLIVVALTAAACSALGDRDMVAPPAPLSEIHAHWPGCAAIGAFKDRDAQPPSDGAVPANFVPAAAVWCAFSDRVAPEDDPVRGLERRATDFASLLDYLDRPSRIEAPGSDGACPAVGILPTWLFLLDADGRWIMPRLPTDACGYPLDEFNEQPSAWAALTYRDRVVCTVHRSAESQVCR